MTTTNNTLREKVDAKIAKAKDITWDGCHKVYILMDDKQVTLMDVYGYGDGSDDSRLIRLDDLPADVESGTAQVLEWYQESCGLRFIQAVETNEENPNAGFENVVAQGEYFNEAI